MAKILKKSDFINAKKLKKNFPNIKSGLINEPNLRTLAQKIQGFQDNPIFQQYSTETIVKFLRIASDGGEFKGENLEGLLGIGTIKEIYSKKIKNNPGLQAMRKTTGFVEWVENEEDFIINLYKQNLTPKEIFKKYQINENFNKRSYNAILSFLDLKRKKGEIGRQRINWNEDLGFFALYLLHRYGKKENYLTLNVKTLDEYFFSSQGIITKSKLNNFYKRENKK